MPTIRRAIAQLCVAGQGHAGQNTGMSLFCPNRLRHGLRLAGMERLRVGETVWITLPGLPPRQAKVMWVDRFEAGCAFVEPLHEAVFDAIVSGHMH